jgi:hypothetical protein
MELIINGKKVRKKLNIMNVIRLYAKKSYLMYIYH